MSSNAGRAQTLYDRSAQRWQEIADWVVTNSLDLLLATLAATFIAIVLLFLRRSGHKLIRDRVDGAGPATVSWREIFGRVLAKTNLFFITMTAIKLVAAQADAPDFLNRTIDILFIIASALQAAIWGRELILGFIEHRFGDEPDQGRLASAIGIIRLFVSIALFAIALIVILDNVGVNVTGLVAGLGIGGIAIGLAAQGIFSDLFAALAIIFDRPFRRGDTITFGNPPTTGTVELIGLKTTRVRSLSGEEIVISNARILDQQLQNWAMLRERRVVMQIGLIFQTPRDLLERIPGEFREIVGRTENTRFDRAHAFQFGTSSIDYELVFHVTRSDMDVAMQARQDILLGILRRFDELGVLLAYPTQTSFTAAPDGTPVMPYPQVKMLATEQIVSGGEEPDPT